MPANAQLPLRPLRTGELLDRAIRLLRRHFFLLAGITAVFFVPLTILDSVTSYLILSGNTAESNRFSTSTIAPEGFGVGAAILAVFTFIATLILTLGAVTTITLTTARSYLGLPIVTIRDAFQLSKDRWFPLVGASLLGIVLMTGLVLWALVPCIGWITGFGMLLYFWTVILPMLAPIVVLERRPPIKAWRRAWELARPRFWWVFLFATVLSLFTILIGGGPAALLSYLSSVASPDGAETGNLGLQTVVQSLINLIVNILTVPLTAIGITLLYFDLRVRQEGLDLMLGASEAINQLDTLESTVPAEISGKLLAREDWLNFLVCTVIAVAFFVTIALVVSFAGLYPLRLG